MAERLIFHIASVVTPLPLVSLPIVDATDPKVRLRFNCPLHVFAQQSILKFVWFGQPAVSIFALEMCIQPIHTVAGNEVAFAADALEMWRTHGVHSFGATLLGICERR